MNPIDFFNQKKVEIVIDRKLRAQGHRNQTCEKTLSLISKDKSAQIWNLEASLSCVAPANILQFDVKIDLLL